MPDELQRRCEKSEQAVVRQLYRTSTAMIGIVTTDYHYKHPFDGRDRSTHQRSERSRSGTDDPQHEGIERARREGRADAAQFTSLSAGAGREAMQTVIDLR